MDAGDRAFALWARQGEPAGIPGGSTLMNRGSILFHAGRYARAIDCLQRALEMFEAQQAATWTIATENSLANVYLRLGQSARAQRLLASTCTVAVAPPVRGRRLALRCLLAQRHGSPTPPAWLSELQQLATQVQETDRQTLTLAHATASTLEQSLPTLDRLLVTTDGQSPTVALSCRLRAADALRRLGRHADALAMARVAADDVTLTVVPKDVAPGERWWLLYRVFQEAGATDEAERALRHGVAAIEAELPHVPEAFRDSFLHRNPFNRDLLAAAKNRSSR